MSRVTLEDNMMTIAVKMSDGNPGAVTVIAECFKNGAAIDPQSWAGEIGAVLTMDDMGIYGSRIWMLYKDVCHSDLRVMIALLRATGLGLLKASDLNHAIDNRGAGINVAELVTSVEGELTEFQRATAV